jgi:hypothetical protein
MSATAFEASLRYTLTFTEDELILLVQCLQADAMAKQDQPAVEIEPGKFSSTPLHSALMIRMLNERTDTISRMTNFARLLSIARDSDAL